jgi:hypothetical protein
MLASDLRYALDPVAFASEVLGFTTPDPWQVETLRWTGKRLLLNCHRQSGKSTTAAIITVHRAIFRPGSLILLVSPSLRQSGELFKKVTATLAKVQNCPKLVEDNRLSFTLSTGSRVVSLPSSEATIRGFSGVDLIIEDEASRVDDDLYRAVRPMLAVSGGGLILMSTPFGKRGHFFEEWTAGGSDWKRVEVPAIQCPRISKEFLAEERRSLGEVWFRQEYFCSFEDTVNQVFGYDLVMSALTNDVKPLFGG